MKFLRKIRSELWLQLQNRAPIEIRLRKHCRCLISVVLIQSLCLLVGIEYMHEYWIGTKIGQMIPPAIEFAAFGCLKIRLGPRIEIMVSPIFLECLYII